MAGSSQPKAVGAGPARGAQHGATIAMKENLPHDFFQETENILRHVDADLTGGAWGHQITGGLAPGPRFVGARRARHHETRIPLSGGGELDKSI